MIRRNNHTLMVAIALVAVTTLAGCGKAPVQEIEAAKLAVTAVLEEGGLQYLPDETKNLQNDLEAALEEVKVQDEKFFKDYGQVADVLRKVSNDADSTKNVVIAKKEQMRTKAAQDVASARFAVEEAAVALEKAPAGKGTTEDIEAMKQDVAALRDLLLEAEHALNAGDYATASTHALAVSDKATAVSTEVAAAIAKVSRARGGKQYHD